jgi:hypothetical protein
VSQTDGRVDHKCVVVGSSYVMSDMRSEGFIGHEWEVDKRSCCGLL